MKVHSATKALIGLLVLMSLGASGQLAAQALPSDSAQVLSADSASKHNIDYRTLKTIQLHRTSFGNGFWVPVSNTFVLSVLPAPVMLVGSLSASGTTSAGIPRSTAMLYDAAQAGATLLLNAAVTMGLKSLVGRPRPYVTYQGDLVCLQKVASSSFPSGHTSFAFSTATMLSLLYPRWYVVAPSYLWAAAVGFSRMYIGAHYPSDVLAGALIGTASAVVVHLLRQRLARSNPNLTPANAVLVPVTLTF